MHTLKLTPALLKWRAEHTGVTQDIKKQDNSFAEFVKASGKSFGLLLTGLAVILIGMIVCFFSSGTGGFLIVLGIIIAVIGPLGSLMDIPL